MHFSFPYDSSRMTHDLLPVFPVEIWNSVAHCTPFKRNESSASLCPRGSSISNPPSSGIHPLSLFLCCNSVESFSVDQFIFEDVFCMFRTVSSEASFCCKHNQLVGVIHTIRNCPQDLQKILLDNQQFFSSLTGSSPRYFASLFNTARLCWL